MFVNRRSFLLASAAMSIAMDTAKADVVQLIIRVELSNDRNQIGALKLQNLSGATLAGPFNVFGRSDDSMARAHGNATHDSTKPYGDTPSGTYEIPKAVATGDSTSYASHSYGPNGALVLKPKSGDAATAASNGRIGLLIHGGDPGSGGKLRATHGCLRLSNSDMASLMAAIIAAGNNVQFSRCELTRANVDIGPPGDPVCGEDVGDPPPGIGSLLNPGTIFVPPPG